MSTDGPRIDLLGPVEVVHGERRVPVHGRQCDMLAALALTPGRPVSYQDLCEAIWSEHRPAHPRASLHTLASRLRTLVGGDRIVQASDGYQLQIGESQVDLFRFRRLVIQSRRASQQTGGPDSELGLLREAMRLWRGQALENVRSHSLQLHQAVRITEEWFVALERRQELELAVGDDSGLIAELRELTARYPLRESLWARLVRALHQANRQADAYAAYLDIIARLREELGADPGSDLAQAYDQVLHGTPARSDATVNTRPVSDRTIRYPPRELPSDLPFFVGRQQALTELDRLLARHHDNAATGPTIAIIDGSPGVGKTALAVHWANRVAGSFPDGQIYLNLRGFGPVAPVDTASAIRTLLRTLGVPADQVPDDPSAASALLRTVSAGKRILFLFDNVRSTEHVRPMRPGHGCLALVTSRNQLRGLVAREAATRVSLPPLHDHESVDLLAQIVGTGRISAEPTAAGRLADLCDHTPLALQILAERMSRQPDTTLAQFADDLSSAGGSLDSFDTGDDSGTSLRAVIWWSYAGLDPDTARTFRLIGGVHPGGDISVAAAAALIGTRSDVARLHLDRLTADHLLEQRRRDRYQMHDLVRAFAAERSSQTDKPVERETAVRRTLDWYVHTADHADRIIAPHRRQRALDPPTHGVSPLRFADKREAINWYDAEYATLIALPGWAMAEGAFTHCYQLADRLTQFTIFHHARYQDLLATHEIALQAAVKTQDFGMQGHLLSAMAIANADLGRRDESDRCHDQALAAFRRVQDGHGEAKVLGNAASLIAERGDYERARLLCERAFALCKELGYERNRALNLDTLGEIHFAEGEHAKAIICWRRAMEINGRAGSRYSQVINATNLGRAYAALGRFERAARHYQRALSISDELGSRRAKASPLLHLGYALRASGDHAKARGFLTEALSIMDDLLDPRATEARAALEALDDPTSS